jgi:hypothetical protein
MDFDPTKSFRLNNIRLASANFTTVENVAEMVIDQEDHTIQTRRWVFHSFVDRVTDSGSINLLQVSVNLGLRLVESLDSSSETSEEDEKIVYTIEVALITEFELMDTSFSEEDVEQFAERNAVHVAWPFWRQHVFSTLQSASLPVLQIPLMAGVSGRVNVEEVE